MDDKKQENDPRLGELISLSEAAEISGLSGGQLRLLVGRGVIWGKKIGRNWVTSRQAVKDYVAAEHKPGRKKKSQ